MLPPHVTHFGVTPTSTGWLSRNNFAPTDKLQATDMNNLANDLRVWGGPVSGGGYTLSNVVLDLTAAGGLASPVHIAPTPGNTSAEIHLMNSATPALNRWVVQQDGSAETGSNAGSNFLVSRYNDAGTLIDSPLSINRATGVVSITGLVPTTRQVLAGSGLTGGGALSADVTLSLALTSALITAAGGVVTSGSYANPAWITSLAWSKITGAPATGVSSVFTRAGAVVAAAGDYTAAQVTNAVDATQTYANPAWISSLAASKLTGAPPAAVIAATQTPWLQNIAAAGFGVSNAASFALAKTYAETPSILFQSNGNGILQLQSHYSSTQEYPVQIGVPDGSGAIAFFTSAIVTPPTAPAFTERMRVHNAGHVGIGNDGTPIRSVGLSAIHLTVGSVSLPGEICVAGNQTGVSSYVCAYDFGNWAIGGSNNRLGAISAYTESAANAGRLVVTLWNAGAAVTPLICSTLATCGVIIQAASSAGLDSLGGTTGQFYAYSTSNTSLVFRMRGADGVWRQATLTLA